MAKKKPYKSIKRSARMVYIPIAAVLSLGALGPEDLLAGPISSNLTHDFWCVGTKLTWSIETLTDGEVPLQFGLSHSDYTSAEVEECVEVEVLGPLGKIEQEQANRLVRHVGVFARSGLVDQGFNDGKPAWTACKFVLQDGSTLEMWCHNRSGAALTAGAVISIMGWMLGYWLY